MTSAPSSNAIKLFSLQILILDKKSYTLKLSTVSKNMKY